MDELNRVMETTRVVEVLDDGTVAEPSRVVDAPEVHVDTDEHGQILAEHEAEMISAVTRQGWELLTGYTGQYSYRGPIMHPSEYIGGHLERDILAEPGYYVAVVVHTDDDELAGWAVARRHVDGAAG